MGFGRLVVIVEGERAVSSVNAALGVGSWGWRLPSMNPRASADRGPDQAVPDPCQNGW